MHDIDKAFFLKWYGPFDSIKALRDWEQNQNYNYHLYLLHGMKKYSKKKECYYCGMTIRTAYKRLNDAEHHITEIQNRKHAIYVARFSNVESIDHKDIRLVEKLITSYLGWSINEDKMLNRTNFYAPNCPNEICITNRWYNWKTGNEYQRTPANSPAHIVPDVLVYRYDPLNKSVRLTIAPRLKFIW